MYKIGSGAHHTAVISNDNLLYVWGSCKQGQLPKPTSPPKRGEQDNVQQHTIGEPLHVELKFKNRLFHPFGLSCGKSHTAVVAKGSGSKGAFKKIEGAEMIFEKLNWCLKQTGKSLHELFKSDTDIPLFSGSIEELRQGVTIGEVEEEKEKIKEEDEDLELSEEDIDKKDFSKTLRNLGINSKDIDDLIYELSKVPTNDSNTLDIDEIRDQLNGYRLDDGRVFMFGVPDHRTGVKSKEVLKKEEESKKNPVSPLQLGKKQPLKAAEGFVKIAKFGRETHPIVAVACGSAHSIALSEVGAIYTWGDGSYGGLGTGRKAHVYNPIRIIIEHSGTEIKIKGICCGSLHSMALSNENEVFSWGTGEQGRLGHGDTHDCLVPTEVSLLSQERPLFIAAGESHSACINAHYQLFTWGGGIHGRLGHGVEGNEHQPKMVEDLMDEKIVFVSCGVFHTLCLNKDGVIFAFGEGKYGKLGISVDKDTFNQGSDVPAIVDIRPDKLLVQVLAGFNHSFAIDKGGNIYSWGFSGARMLQRGDRKKEKLIPYKPDKIRKIKACMDDEDRKHPMNLNTEGLHDEEYFSTKIMQVVCSDFNTIALTDGGEIYIFGSSAFTKEEKNPKSKKKIEILRAPDEPFRVPFFTSKRRIMYVSAGPQHILAISRSRELFAWGNNRYGELGLGRITDTILCPTVVLEFRGKSLKTCACGDNYSAVLTDFGELYTFGSLQNGRLGLGHLFNEGSQLVPKLVEDLPPIVSVCLGDTHVLAVAEFDPMSLQSDGSVYSWGKSSKGQLGHGNKENQYLPKKINSLKSERVKKVVCGQGHSIALTQQGKLFFWGDVHFAGSLEEVYDIETPQIMKFSTELFIDVSAHHKMNLALTEKGAIHWWGKFPNEPPREDGRKEGKNQNFIPMKLTSGIKQEVFFKCLDNASNHGAAISKRSALYTWGITTTGRLGQDLSNQEKMIPNPKLVLTLNKILQKNINELQRLIEEREHERFIEEGRAEEEEKKEEVKGGEGDKEGQQGGGKVGKAAPTPTAGKGAGIALSEGLAKADTQTYIKTMKALQQKLVNEEKQSVDEERLLVNDNKCEEKLKLTLKLVNQLKDFDWKRQNRKIKIESSLISRIADPPFKINPPIFEKRKEKMFPPGFYYNKKSLEKLFRALHLHPCYLAKIYSRGKMKGTMLFDVIKEIYSYSFANRRQVLLLVSLAKLCFLHELKREKVWERLDFLSENSLFGKVFEYLFVNQPSNIAFINNIGAFLFDNLYKALSQNKKESETTGAFGILVQKGRSKEQKADMSLREWEEQIKKKLVQVKKLLSDFIKGLVTKNIVDGKHPANFFHVEEHQDLSVDVTYLLSFCMKELIRTSPKDTDEFENIRYKSATKLLRKLINILILQALINKHLSNILQNAKETLLFATKVKADKNKEALIGELDLHSGNLKVFSSILDCFFTGLPFAEKSLNKSINDFDQELVQEGKSSLVTIIDKLLDNYKNENLCFWHLDELFTHSLEDTETTLTLSMKNIKKVLKVLEKHLSKVVSILPPENDPIYEYFSELDLKKMPLKPHSSIDTRKVNIKIRTRILIEDKDVKKCKVCEAMLPSNLASPLCVGFIEKFDPADCQSIPALFEKVTKRGREISMNDNLDDYFTEEHKKNHKNGDYQQAEIINMLKDKIETDVKNSLNSKTFLTTYVRQNMERKIRVELFTSIVQIVEEKYKKKVEHKNYIEKVKELLMRIKSDVVSGIDKMELEETAFYEELLDNIQYGISNHELEKYANGQNGLAKMKGIIDFVKSQPISKDLFENLDLKEKKKLLPFSKRKVDWLTNRQILKALYIDGISQIHQKVSMVFNFHVDQQLEVKIVFQDMKNTLCGKISDEVEVTLYSFKITNKEILKLKKTAVKKAKKTVLFGDGVVEFNQYKLVDFINSIEKYTTSYKQNTSKAIEEKKKEEEENQDKPQ